MDWEWGTTHKNPYGFIRDHYSFLSLGQLIGMENKSKEFQDIVEDLGNLRKKYLNIKYCAVDQVPTLRLMEIELKKRHPEVFEGEHGPKHLYFALRVVMQYHSEARYRLRRKSKPRRSLPTNGAKTARNNAPSVPSRDIQRAKVPTPSSREALPYVLMPPRRRNPQPNISVSHNTMPTRTAEVNDLNNNRNSQSVSPNSVDGARSSVISAIDQVQDVPPPQYTSRTSGPSRAKSHPSPSKAQTHSIMLPSEEYPTAIREPEIHMFLHTCQPPMTHYLRRFTDFGCVTSTQLRSVSLWRSEQRHNLLKKILAFGERDAVPSEMDIAVLENQFETYFLED